MPSQCPFTEPTRARGGVSEEIATGCVLAVLETLPPESLDSQALGITLSKETATVFEGKALRGAPRRSTNTLQMVASFQRPLLGCAGGAGFRSRGNRYSFRSDGRQAFL